MKLLVFISSFFFFFTSQNTVCAQTNPDTTLHTSLKKAALVAANLEIDRFAKQALKNAEVVPGMAVAVVKDGKVVYAKGHGYADATTQLPAESDTRFYIASSTKAFSGMLALILEQEGKLDLKKDIDQYAPIKNFTKKEVFEGITLQDLLSHQGGIDNPYLSFRLAYTGDYTHADVLRILEEETQPNENGKAFLYTNFGFYILSEIIRAELGQDWRELMQEKLFAPLGMTHSTGFISKIPKEKLAQPHVGLWKDQLEVSSLKKNDKTLHAAGGLLCSAEDAARFLAFCTSEGKLDGKQIYPAEMVRRAFRSQTAAEHPYVKVFEGTGYGLGWRTGEFEGEKVVYHFGGFSGTYAHFSFLPEKGIGVAVICNSAIAGPMADAVAKFAYRILQGKKAKSEERFIKKKLPKLLAKYQKEQRAHKKKLAERKWQLSLPKAAYTGSYKNKNLGNTQVRLEEGKLIFAMGQAVSTATAFEHPECVRVEIAGTGYLVCFEVKDGKVVGFNHRREFFNRED